MTSRKEAHSDSESLRRRLDKLEASNARYKTRVKKLRTLLDERTEKLTELWGCLDDIKREIERIRPDGEPGDWKALVDTVRKVASEYKALSSRQDVIEDRLEEAMRRVSLWQWVLGAFKKPQKE